MEQKIERVDKVKEQIADAGWGNRFDADIDRHLAAGEKRFKLPGEELIEDRGKQHKLAGELDFSVSDDGKLYYNGTKATLYKEGETTGVTQFFPHYDRITVTEAANLLIDTEVPRAVYKYYFDENSQRYGQWQQIDFSKKTENGNHVVNTYHDNYGFKLYAKFDEYAFVGLDGPQQKREACKAMEQGTELLLTPVNNKEHEVIRMTANPSRRGFGIRDMDGNFLTHDQFRTQEVLEKKHQFKQTTSVDFSKPSGKEHAKQEESQQRTGNATNEKKNSTQASASASRTRVRTVQEAKSKYGKKAGR
ncbi:hypothetical protein [Chitinophaga sp. S165]|uniref:hypothetical protein n=1 Tax=Chitinophaga sp. S165 TaxID=2135462 RepID=UPI000D70E63F|nr:hypothetical protein [Chitinophaga sp. S165]PWV47141.1 hypothetical protein C7475_109229 [Chitinophaga sp. S165]